MRLVAVILLTAVSLAPTVFAEDPTISAQVYDGKPALITITNQPAVATVSGPTILLKGKVRNVSQIMVYNDEEYSMTHALNTGATMYSFTASVNVGEQVIKLVAINPYEGTTTETSISVVYTPGEQPVPTQTVKNVSQGAKDTKEYFDGQVSQASGTEPMKTLSDAAYSVMKAADLVPTTATESLPRTISRFAAVVGGLTMLLFANPILTVYYFFRYQLLQWRIHALPQIVHHHAKLALHVFGGICLLTAFLV